MNIITDRGVIYSSAIGDTKAGQLLNKATQKKEGGTVAGNLLRKFTSGGAKTEDIPAPAPSYTPDPPKKGLSTPVIIGMGAAAVLVGGLIIWSLNKK